MHNLIIYQAYLPRFFPSQHKLYIFQINLHFQPVLKDLGSNMDPEARKSICANKLEESKTKMRAFSKKRGRELFDNFEEIEKIETTLKLCRDDLMENLKTIENLKSANLKIKHSIDAKTRELEEKKKERGAHERRTESVLSKMKEEVKFYQDTLDTMSQETSNVTGQEEILRFIDDSIEEKERELECPICLEIATVPIFMCSESHVVCEKCYPKISRCAICRDPRTPKRHRYAEKIADEVIKLNSKRRIILKSNERETPGIRGQEVEAKPGPQSVLNSQQLFVSNLPPNCTEGAVTACFSVFGRVLRIKSDRRRGHWRTGARGVVTFADSGSVNRALNTETPIMLGGNRLELAITPSKVRKNSVEEHLDRETLFVNSPIRVRDRNLEIDRIFRL